MSVDAAASRRAQVGEVMARVVAGDSSAMVTFFDLATPPVRGMVLAKFQEVGIWVSGDRLDDLVRDLLVELLDLAPVWRDDGGALPWVWARSRLLAVAFAKLGVLADDIDGCFDLADDRGSSVGSPLAPVTSCAEGVVEVLRRAAHGRPQVSLLLEALEGITCERDRTVWLDVLDEQAAGNRSPAVTVAQLHDVSPALVRKICQRVRDRLTLLGRTDHRFQPLLTLPALAA